MAREQQKGYEMLIYLFMKGSSSNDEINVIEGNATSSLEISNNIVETSPTKDEILGDQGIIWQTNVDGTRSWSISVEITLAKDQAGVPTQQKVLDLIVEAENTLIPVWYGKVVNKEDGGKEFVGKKGEARIASYSQSDPGEGSSTVSLSLTGNGALTKVTEADWANIQDFKAGL